VVAAAVISDDAGRLLMARRPEGKHMAGLWEFPGGKVAAHEKPDEALVRELREELAVESRIGEPLTFAVHDEPERRILLLFYAATVVGGAPRPMEGQEIRWVAPQDLPRLSTPPADQALIRRLAEGVDGALPWTGGMP
jgi:8-oxo-dGTP diphosphatase